MSEQDLDAFIAIVVSSPESWPELRAIADRTLFIEAVEAAAASRGLKVTADVVGDRLDAARRSWLERWV